LEDDGNRVVRLATDLDHQLKLREEFVELSQQQISILSKGTILSQTNLEDVATARVEEGIGIARLVLELKDGTEREVAYFTKRKLKQFRALANALTDHHQVSSDLSSLSGDLEKDREEKSKAGTLIWLLRFMRPYKRKLAVGVILSILVTAFNLVPPYLLKILIDNVLLSTTPTRGLFGSLTLILLASYGAITVFSLLQSYVLNTLGQKVVNDMRSKVYEHTMNLPSGFIERMTTGRILSRLTTDVGNTQWLMVWGLPSLIVNVLTLLGIGIILFALDAGLAVFVLIPVPFIIYALVRYRRRSFMTYHRNWRRSADVTSMIADTIPGYQVVKSFVREDREARTLEDNLERLYQSQTDAVKMNLFYWPALGFLTSIATVAIWWIGGNQVILGGIQLGIITAFVAYMAQFYAPINNLSNIVPFIQQGTTSGDRLREIIETEPEIQSKPDAVKPDLGGEILFDRVWFGYEPFNPVIKEFDLTIPKGKRVAIIGRSGSGKTSVSRLLMRFYDVNSGAVMIGGVDVRDIELGYLRGKIAYVPQEVLLFDNTVARNVAYGASVVGDNDFDPLAILAACKLAGIHKEMMSMPLSYDTNLGEKGSSLSGGQRQRISLARAIIKKPDIFILDEATSDLDVLSEREIYRRMLKLAEGKTTILVTHNIYEAMSVDTVIVMGRGRILEQGNPHELLHLGKEFASMFQEYSGENPFQFETDISKIDLGDVSVKLPMVPLDEIEVRQNGRMSRVELRLAEDEWVDLRPRLPFPLSHPEVVILEKGDGGEVLSIPDYRMMNTQSREVLERAIRSNSFILRVKAVDRILIRGDELEWQLITEEGRTIVNTRGRRNVIAMDHKVILVDPHDNLSEIDLRRMDKRSLKILNRTV
jgi:ATP-binding cassette subfamily C protein